MAEATGQVDAPEAVDGAKCPFARVNTLEDVSRLLRSKTAVTHSPDLFASRASDEVNGEINVREFLAASMMYTEGDSHRLRRKLLNPLVRADALQGIREDVVLPEADRLMALWLAEPDADGRYRMDLIEFLERIFIHFTARLIGLIDMDTDERLALMRSFAGPLAAGTSSGYLADRDDGQQEGAGGQAPLRRRSSSPRRCAGTARCGPRSTPERSPTQEVPSSLLKLVAAGAAPEWADEANAIVESTLLFAASVGTSTQSIVHTIDFLQAWFAEHPEDLGSAGDPTFLLHCLQETIRLRAPFSPYTTRLSLEQNQLSDGTMIYPGQELHLEWVKANRDTLVFGPDAVGFNPNRPTPGRRDAALRPGLRPRRAPVLRAAGRRRQRRHGRRARDAAQEAHGRGRAARPGQPAGRPGEGHGQVRCRGHPEVHQVPGDLRQAMSRGGRRT